MIEEAILKLQRYIFKKRVQRHIDVIDQLYHNGHYSNGWYIGVRKLQAWKKIKQELEKSLYDQ